MSAGDVTGVDPSAAVDALLAEAEMLRLQADVARMSTRLPDRQDGPLRDLSPLGR